MSSGMSAITATSSSSCLRSKTNKVAGLWTQDDSGSSSRRSTTVANAASPSGYAFVGNGEIKGQDRGHPFIMKGVDIITGGVNGFFNMGAAFGAVTNTCFPTGGFVQSPVSPSASLRRQLWTDLSAGHCPLLRRCWRGKWCGLLGTLHQRSTNANVTNLIDVRSTHERVGHGWNVTKPTRPGSTSPTPASPPSTRSSA